MTIVWEESKLREKAIEHVSAALVKKWLRYHGLVSEHNTSMPAALHEQTRPSIPPMRTTLRVLPAQLHVEKPAGSGQMWF